MQRRMFLTAIAATPASAAVPNKPASDLLVDAKRSAQSGMADALSSGDRSEAYKGMLQPGLVSPVGAGLDGFDQTRSYGAKTLGRAAANNEFDPSNAPWNAKFDNVTDDTEALHGCLMSLQAAGGGTMKMPRGKAVCNNLVYTFPDNNTTINIRGHGKNATVLRKTTSDADPVITLKSSSTTVPASIESEFSDWSVVGNAFHGPGIQLTLLSRFSMDNLGASQCSIAFNNLGSLIFSTYGCNWITNVVGYKSRLQGPTRCNRISMVDGTVSDNTAYGYDIGDSTGLVVYGADVERNGTRGRANSGDVVIRSSVDREIGSSQISFIQCHHEGNTGKGFTVESAAGLVLELNSIRFDSNTSGTALNVGAISTLVQDRVIATNAVNVAPIVSVIRECSFSVLNDASIYKFYEIASSNAGLSLMNVRAGALGGISVDNLGVVRLGPAAVISTGDVTVKGGNSMLTTSSAMVNAAGTATGTLTNAPHAGPPDLWAQFNINGVTYATGFWKV